MGCKLNSDWMGCKLNSDWVECNRDSDWVDCFDKLSENTVLVYARYERLV